MKRLLQTFVLIVSVAGVLHAQKTPITIVSPSGLDEPPYEVAAGTSVTFQVDFNGVTPTAFYSSATEPVFPDFGPDPSWNALTNFKDNGNGTYSLTLVVNGPTYVWAGIQSDFIGWTFSGVTAVSIASGVELSYPNGFLCSSGSNSEILSVKGTYSSYQWYRDGESIPNATSATYTATAEGAYKVQVPLSGKNVFSNTLHLKTAQVNFTGTLSGTNLTLQATGGMDTYTWLSGTSESSLSAISSATGVSYTAAVVAQTKYYAIKVVKAGCEFQSQTRAASTALFAKPVIAVSAQVNGSGKICLGTQATLSVPDIYGAYAWYLDGNNYFSDTHTATAVEETGSFRADVTPAGWPEITISSAVKKVGYYNMIAPDLTGPANNSTHCPGETIKETLNDEGYTYSWYLHTNYDYTEDDNVTPATGYSYSFTFSEAINLTLVAKSLGCEATTRYNFLSYDDAQLYLSMSDYDQEFLCEGSTTDLIVDGADQYTGFKWYKDSEEIDGETGSTYTVTEPGTYYATAHATTCPSSLNTSFVKEIRSSTERELFINSDKDAMCEGEKATLSIPGDWTAIQWFEKTIKITDHGYADDYIPIDGAGSERTLEVDKYTTYLVKAKHPSCLTGVKTWSEPFQIRPLLNPNIKVEPWEGKPRRWHKAFFDSIPNYLFCADAPVSMSVDSEETYDTYEWLMKPYNGDGAYTPGDKIEGESSGHIDIIAFGARWYTAKITSGNCVGYSDAVLIDTWVHNTPDVAAIGNAELCGEDDKLTLSVAFNGNWVKYEWYNYNELIPDSDNDSLTVTQPGAYTVMGYPEECPQIGYSSGLPVVVNYFPDATINEEADYIYAWPWEGYYGFQWFLNGQPIDVRNGEDSSGPPYEADTDTNEEDDYDDGYLYKRRMQPGVYTVTVVNLEDCSSTSPGFTWTVPITGTEPEKEYIGFAAHPNPTSGAVTLKGLTKDQIKTVGVTSAHGQSVPSYFNAADQSIDLSTLPAGVYVVEVTLKDNSKKSLRVLRK